MVQLTHKKDKGSCRDLLMMTPRHKLGNGNSNNHNTNNSINHSNNNIDNSHHDTTGKAAFKPQAKQRTTIKWLLSKAYNNKIPEELSEPFYKDHEGEEHLKPHVVQGLSNAELYCLALCNIYADPNFSQLSPWGIVQALARKGSYVQAPADVQLTETVLIQNTPLKISAHMAVIEAMMVLQVREIISNERVMNTVQRYGPNVHPLRVWLGSGEMPSDAEEALLLWINRSVLAIKDFIQNNNAHEHNLSSSQVESWSQLPLFQDLTDLADGVGLCSLLAFYCQEELALSEISVPNPGEPLSVSDSLWNLQLVQRVCRDSLPYNVCHFTFEDVLYLHESMKQNMLNFLADLFNQLELQPAQCVKLLGSHQMIPIRPAGLTAEGVRMRRGFIQQSPITIPDLRPSLYSYQTTCASSSAASSSDRNAMSSRPQSATSTPKRQLSVKERSQRSAQNIFGEHNTPAPGTARSEGRRSPSNASVVSVPLRRSTTPHDYSDRAHSEKSGNQKDHRYYAHSRSSEESEDFVVHRGRNVPTLSQVIRSVSPSSQDERSSPASRMSVSRRDHSSGGGAAGGGSDPNDSSDPLPPAGRPSDWKANKTTYAGRRSRRNSITEADSQLTVENFGGSQDNLNRFTIGRNPDKQPAIVTDATPSPIRYVKRQHSQDPPDYYSSPDPQPQSTPSPVSVGGARDPSKRASMCESGGGGGGSNSGGGGGGNSGGDVIFYGKKKLSVTMDQYEQEHYAVMNSRPSDDVQTQHQQSHGQPSGNFNHFHQPKLNHHDDYHQQNNNHSPPQENGNLTVYVMNNNDQIMGGGGVAGGHGGMSGDAPLRSLSMTNLSRLSDLPNKPINIVYLQSSEGNTPPSSSTSSSNNPPPVSHSYRVSNSSNGWGGGSEYGAPDNYHTLPAGRAHHQQYNTPPHQQQYQQQYHQQNPYSPQQQGSGGPQSHHYSPQQQQQYQSHQHNRYSSPSRGGGGGGGGEEDFDTDDIAAQLNAIRFKLEEKRKRIEMEKTKMETIVTKQQAKLGKAAYLKAINKGKGGEGGGVSSSSSSTNTASQLHRSVSGGGADHAMMMSARKKQLSLKDLESKWLSKTDEPCRTPEIENMDIETYQRSLARMDTSLTELETDIGRLTQQQEQIRRQFFLHGDQQVGGGAGGSHSNNNDTAKRKTWTVPMSGSEAPPASSSSQQPPQRSQWGNPKPYGNNSSSDSDNTNNPASSESHRTPPRVVYNGDVRTATAPHLHSSRGGGSSAGANNNTASLSYNSSFRLHSNSDTQGNRLFGRQNTTEETDEPEAKPTPPPRQRGSGTAAATVYHAPLPTPPPDDMEPQSVSFVQDDTTPLANELGSMSSGSTGKKSSLHQITSGSKTYRITPESGSPPRPSAHRLFTSDAPAEGSLTSSDENPSFNERGFYIALDNEGPKRPKPPLRTRSPAKRMESGTSSGLRGSGSRRDLTTEYIQSIVDHVPIHKEEEDDFDDQENRFYGHGHHRGDLDICDGREKASGELVIDEKPQMDPEMEYEMEKKKERILMQSLKRQQQVEESRRVKEMETQRKREIEAAKQEEKMRKKEEEKARRQAILESYRLKKQEEMDKDTKGGWEVQESSAKKFMRPKSSSSVGTRPRPKTIHLPEVDSAGASGSETPRHGALRRSDSQTSSTSLARSYGKRGSSNTLYSAGGSNRSGVRDPWGSTSSLNQETRRRPASSYDRRSRTRDLSTSRLEVRSRRDSYLGSQESLAHHRHNSTSSLLDGVETDASSSAGGGGHNTGRDSDSGVGTCSPPARRRSPSPATTIATSASSGDRGVSAKSVTRRNLALGLQQQQQQQPSCSLPSPSGNGPGSLPPGLISRRHRGFDDGASDISSVASSNMDYSGLRLYKQPTAKSNRSIILNAVEYCVFPGVVNRDAKMKVLDEINRSESKHFLVMFRDAGCQFRALYSFIPETEEVIKLYGVGPKQVNDRMFEKFFKYNSGGKCFTQVHTKHLTVTIDAFTIHNALWQGKKLPTTKTKDMALVI